MMGIVSSQWTMSYNRSYVFRHCPLGVNSVRHSRVRVVILLETQVEGGEPEGGEGAQRGQGFTVGVLQTTKSGVRLFLTAPPPPARCYGSWNHLYI
jgi:hypothetical protein